MALWGGLRGSAKGSGVLRDDEVESRGRAASKPVEKQPPKKASGNNPFAGRSGSGSAPAGSSKPSVGRGDANKAYLANLRAQAVERARAEQQQQQNYRNFAQKRPGLPSSGGEGEETPTPTAAPQAPPTPGQRTEKKEEKKDEAKAPSGERTFPRPPAGRYATGPIPGATTSGVPQYGKHGENNATFKVVPDRAAVTASREAPRAERFKQLTWDEYNALDSDSRAAVDANTLLQKAVLKDRELVGLLDANKDGRVSYSEGRKDYGAKDDKNYGENYRRTFSRGTSYGNPRQAEIDSAIGKDALPGLDELTYAPNTLAALNLLNINDSKGSIDEYLSGSAFITERDLSKNAHKRKEETPAWEVGTGRDDLISRLTEGMAAVSQKFDAGEAVVGGRSTALSISGTGDERLSNLVDALRRDMAAGATFDYLTEFDPNASVQPTRVDLSALDDRDYAERRGYLDLLYSNIEAQEGAEALLNKEKILPFLEEEGSDWGEWQRLVTNRQRYGKTNDYRSTATYYGEARDQVMSKVEQILSSGGSVTDEEVDSWINQLSRELLEQNEKEG